MISTMTHRPSIHLLPGTVHRLVADLIQVGLWTEQQNQATLSRVRRCRLHTTHLACRLAAELLAETLCVPSLVNGTDGKSPSPAWNRCDASPEVPPCERSD